MPVNTNSPVIASPIPAARRGAPFARRTDSKHRLHVMLTSNHFKSNHLPKPQASAAPLTRRFIFPERHPFSRRPPYFHGRSSASEKGQAFRYRINN
jgi:hypothetical protein